ncbi:MAG: hypothetical protein M1453_05810 [Acidobacteria bacterium]|nr:hypothetical protein [Acidobacteriota bacterium]MCL5287493.1 hypothetical protein [Acidobacteriota bacterium]
MKTKSLVELRKTAEKSVADMPDGDLKVKAFEVILEHLIESQGATAKAAGRTFDASSRRPQKKVEHTRSTTGRILVLRDEGFFRSQKSIAEICDELATHGWHYPLTSLSGPLQVLVQRRELRRMRHKKGNKTVWVYSEP